VIYVICSDGRQRHGTPFDDAHQAVQFAQWGHCCTNSHSYRTDDPINDDLPTEEDEEAAGLLEPVSY